eukprot:6212654-Pleurochrysis_carterae.AAC.1
MAASNGENGCGPQWSHEYRTAAAMRHADDHSAKAPARRVVLLHPDAQLALDHAVEALDAALALAVASPPVHHLASWPKLPHLLNDPIHLILALGTTADR